jgi:SET domain-containing protein
MQNRDTIMVESIELAIANDCLKINPRLNELTEVRESKISGLGLFAKTFIPKGTAWFECEPHQVLMISKYQYQALCQSHDSPLSKGFIDAIKTYTYYEAKFDALIFCVDNARFVNHSFTPNSGADGPRSSLKSVALRDIYPGEEITENYLSYDQCPWADSCEDFLKP